MLAVVEHQHIVLVAECIGDAVDQRDADALFDAECFGHEDVHAGFVDCRELAEAHRSASFEQLTRRLGRDAGLADAACSHERHESPLAQVGDDLFDQPITSHQRTGRCRDRRGHGVRSSTRSGVLGRGDDRDRVAGDDPVVQPPKTCGRLEADFLGQGPAVLVVLP